HVVTSILSFNHPAPTAIYTLSLHDALPIFADDRLITLRLRHDEIVGKGGARCPINLLLGGIESSKLNVAANGVVKQKCFLRNERSEEHTSALQSLAYLVCRLLLEKKIAKAP